MLKRTSLIGLSLSSVVVFILAQGCGGSSPVKNHDGGAGKTGSAGSGTAGSGAAGSGAAGAGTAGSGAAGAAAGTSGAAGSDGGAGSAPDAMPDVVVLPPDGSMKFTSTFATSVEMWHLAPYGSTPDPSTTGGSPIATNLGQSAISTLVWDGTNDANNLTTSGSLKGTVPFTHEGERVDFQAFSSSMGLYDWTGYAIKMKIKLVSGGNLKNGCPMQAFLYVSQAPDYHTGFGVRANLVKGSWVDLTLDVANAGVDLTMISQMGVQIETGGACVAIPADGGTDVVADGGDAATEAGSDAGVDAVSGGDAADASAPDVAADGGTGDVVADSGAGDAVDGGADAGDAGDAGDAIEAPPPPPVTATTAVILVDDVFVTLK